jgi:hypothetical protein
MLPALYAQVGDAGGLKFMDLVRSAFMVTLSGPVYRLRAKSVCQREAPPGLRKLATLSVACRAGQITFHASSAGPFNTQSEDWHTVTPSTPGT